MKFNLYNFHFIVIIYFNINHAFTLLYYLLFACMYILLKHPVAMTISLNFTWQPHIPKIDKRSAEQHLQQNATSLLAKGQKG